MKINLYNDVNRDEFIVKDVVIANECCYLITPKHIGCHWTKDNLIFRSSIWNSNGELISAGFKKFFNYQEQPDLESQPTDLKGCTSVEKLDGSLLIVSKYKGEMIYRTRGTSTVANMENGYEISLLIEKYKFFFNESAWWWDDTVNVSFLFEWTTPTNKIVIDYGDEPDITLVGIVKHEDYSYIQQDRLDSLAKVEELKRPKTYQYTNITDLTSDVEQFTDKEGICLYFNKDQSIRKVKALRYLKLHLFKSKLNLENMIDVYLNIVGVFGLDVVFPSYKSFCDYIENTFDYEILQMSTSYISNIVDASKEVKDILEGMYKFIEKIKTQTSIRKEQAVAITNSYGITGRTSILFSLLDNKPITKDNLKKLFYQKLKYKL